MRVQEEREGRRGVRGGARLGAWAKEQFRSLVLAESDTRPGDLSIQYKLRRRLIIFII